MIIDHDHPSYRKRWNNLGMDRFNGAYFYSKEIVENIIPLVNTTRNWITINIHGIGLSHSVVFVHNNKNPAVYEWLRAYDDLILVCGVPNTVEKVKYLGKAIFLPLSVDVEYVERFRQPKSRDVAFVGRANKIKYGNLPDDIDYLCDLDRPTLLFEMAKYRQVYTVGRCALEAKILGAEVLPYDDRFPDPRVWEVIDNKEAAAMLQRKLDKIDNGQWLYDPSLYEL